MSHLTTETTLLHYIPKHSFFFKYKVYSLKNIKFKRILKISNSHVQSGKIGTHHKLMNWFKITFTKIQEDFFQMHSPTLKLSVNNNNGPKKLAKEMNDQAVNVTLWWSTCLACSTKTIRETGEGHCSHWWDTKITL